MICDSETELLCAFIPIVCEYGCIVVISKYVVDI